MTWITRTFVFAAALMWGACAVSLLGDLGSWDRDYGFSHCTFHLDPPPVQPSQPPKGVRVMYDGWQPASDERPAALRFIVYNGLDVPVDYLAYSATVAGPEVSIDGKIFRMWECLNGSEFFRIAPGASTEVFATRWDFPSRIRKNAQATVGLHFDLSPRPDQNKPTHDILAITEPFTIPDAFRTARRE